MKFVYLKTACRSLTFPLLHVFTTVVRVQLFLLDEALVNPFNRDFKLLSYQNHLGFLWVDRD